MKVSNDVLAVLSAAEVNGNSLVLQGQLDRPMYVAVNKVLEAAGWKWNRKAKAHICDGEAVDVLEQVLLTGEVTVAKNEFGYFPTPRNVVDRLFELADLGARHYALEPSAGTGAIAAPMREKVMDLDCVELLPRNVEVLRKALPANSPVFECDFLGVKPSPKYDRIVMNPPFNRQADVRHVMHAAKFLNTRGRLVSVMSSGVAFRDDRLTRDFKDLLAASNGDIEELPAGSFKESGTMVNTVIVTLEAA